MNSLPPRIFTVDLFRHAKSLVNLEGTHIGVCDTDLCPEGVTQSERLNKYLRGKVYQPDEVHCSTLPRAQRTALIATKDLIDPSKIVYSDRLVEIKRGAWDGKVRTEMWTPDVLRRMSWEDMDHASPGGESMHDTAARMYRYLLDMCFECPEWTGSRRFAVFSHGLALKCLLHRILGNRPELTWRLDIGNTSITTLKHDAHGWFIKRINCTPHLDKGL